MLQLPWVVARGARGGSSAAATSSGSVTPTVTRQSDIQHWWKFDEGSGSEAQDSVGTAHLDAVGGTFAGTGMDGDASSGDGTDTWRVGNELDPAITGAYTLSGWCYPTLDANTYKRVPMAFSDGVGMGTGTGCWISFFRSGSDNVFRLYHGRSSGNWTTTDSTDALALNNWYYIAATWDASDESSLYVGRVGTDSTVKKFTSTGVSTLTAGQDSMCVNTSFNNNTSWYFAGRVDDVRLYHTGDGDGLLDETAINEIYNGGDGDFI